MAKKYVSAPAPRNIDALLQALLSRVKEEGEPMANSMR